MLKLAVCLFFTVFQAWLVLGGEVKVYQVEEKPSYKTYSSVKVLGVNGKFKPENGKKPTSYAKKKYRVLEKEKEEEYRKKALLEQAKFQGKTSDTPFLKDERGQLCQALNTTTLKETLIKFGVVTHIIDDANKFRSFVKSLKESLPLLQKKGKGGLKHKDGSRVKQTQSNFLGGRSFERGLHQLVSVPDDSDNLLGNDLGSREERSNRYGAARGSSYLDALRRKGTSNNFGTVPECYGWRYLSAINAITPDDSADIDVLSESVSDMLDITFAEIVATILQSCHARLDDNSDLCPPSDPKMEEEVEICESKCEENSDCSYREKCCRQGCSNHCVSILGKKYNPCEQADQYMQCIYNKIDTQLCDPRSGN